MEKDIVRLAEEYCTHFHRGQKRKGKNQEPYAVHPFAVRDILVKYGYAHPETQAIALLHDTIEDTELNKAKQDIEKVFGTAVYSGVYVLSNNTIGKHAKSSVPLFKGLGLEYLDHGRLSQDAYKLRLLFSRNAVKRVKIADMVHNTESLPDISIKGIAKKISDAETFYIPLGKSIAPIMVRELIRNIENYKKSAHYKEVFLGSK